MKKIVSKKGSNNLLDNGGVCIHGAAVATRYTRSQLALRLQPHFDKICRTRDTDSQCACRIEQPTVSDRQRSITRRINLERVRSDQTCGETSGDLLQQRSIADMVFSDVKILHLSTKSIEISTKEEVMVRLNYGARLRACLPVRKGRFEGRRRGIGDGVPELYPSKARRHLLPGRWWPWSRTCLCTWALLPLRLLAPSLATATSPSLYLAG